MQEGYAGVASLGMEGMGGIITERHMLGVSPFLLPQNCMR